MKRWIARISLVSLFLFSLDGMASCNELARGEACFKENAELAKKYFAQCLDSHIEPLISKSQGASVSGVGGFDECVNGVFGAVESHSDYLKDGSSAEFPWLQKAWDQYMHDIDLIIDPVEDRIIQLHAKIVTRNKTKWQDPRISADSDYMSNTFAHYIESLSEAIVDFERLGIANEIKQQYIAEMPNIIKIAITNSSENYKKLLHGDDLAASENAKTILSRDLMYAASAYRRMSENGVAGSDIMLNRTEALSSSMNL